MTARIPPLACVALAVAATTSCTVGPDYVRPPADACGAG
jgi:hypothetical protein